VRELVRVTKPYKLASREMHADDTVVSVAGTRIGPGTFTVIAGPCSVENESMAMEIAEFLRERGVRLFRGGVFKPRTSPYAFQGLEDEGLRILERVRERTGVGIVTEVMEPDQVERVEQASDILQIGTRNMQNFPLLREVGRLRKPVLLKRGAAATLDELVLASEYIRNEGNDDVMLCERGVRSFDPSTRYLLDLAAVPVLKARCDLPVIVDPSHGTGASHLVAPMAKAALAAGADGLLIEVHAAPEHALCDGKQAMRPADFATLCAELRRLAPLCGRQFVDARRAGPVLVAADGRAPRVSSLPSAHGSL